MKFSLDRSLEILERTPGVMEQLLGNISDDWSLPNEGENTFSPYDVVGHLIHGEKTDWIVRMDIILSDNIDKTFKPYDRFAQYTESKGKSMDQLVQEFKQLREANLKMVRSKKLTEADFLKTATHPALGIVTLRQLFSAWTIHDLSHLAQVARVMCKQYADEVGPWKNYLPILTR